MWTHVYGLDIETDTTPETPEELAAGYKPGNRGLDPRIGRVTSAAVAFDGGCKVFRHDDEAELLSDLYSWLHDQEPGLICTWNGANFDFPFLHDRAEANELDVRRYLHMTVDPALAPKYAPLPGHKSGYRVDFETRSKVRHAHLDLAYALKAKAEQLGVKWSLKPVMTALGVDMIEVDRTKMHLLTPEEEEAYVASDAIGTRVGAIKLLTGTL